MNPPATALPGQNDNRVIIPYFTMRKLFPTAQEHQLMVEAKDGQAARRDRRDARPCCGRNAAFP